MDLVVTSEGWLVWLEDDVDGMDGARLTLGTSARDAVEQWAEAEDRHDRRILGRAPVIVLVLNEYAPRGMAPERWEVRGERAPTYTATKLDDPPVTVREPAQGLSLTVDDADVREEAQARAEHSALTNGGEVDHG